MLDIVIKHKGGNNRETAQKRIDYIKQKFPRALNANPYTDRTLIDDIKRALLYDSGLYALNKDSFAQLSDETVIKYVLKLQGKSIRNRCKKPVKQVFYGY